MLYIDALKETDRKKRFNILAKAEEREETVRSMETYRTYAEYVLHVDKNYRDRCFWIVENSSGITMEDIKKFTIRDSMEIEKRLSDKIDDENRRNKAMQTGSTGVGG